MAIVVCVLGCAPASGGPPRTPQAGGGQTQDERAAIEACLASAQGQDGPELRCVEVVQARCADGVTLEEASTTAFNRECAARAAAAWDAILGDTAAELDTLMEDNEREAFASAQQAWEAFVTANVRAHAERYAGGTLQAVVAGEVRARMLAERALELRRMVRERRDEISLSAPVPGIQGRAGDLYFPSPEAAVTTLTDLLRKEDWATLARYYDLSDSSISREALTSGRFFLRTERPPLTHPGLPWKYRHPFTPGFTFEKTEAPAQADVIVVVVAIEIDEGGGRIRRGVEDFSMRWSRAGYQVLPPYPATEP